VVNWNLREKGNEDEQMVKGQVINYCGGGRKEGYNIWGEGHSFLSSMFGRVLFKKHSLRGGLRVFEIISIYYQSFNSEFSSFGSLYPVDFNLSLVAA